MENEIDLSRVFSKIVDSFKKFGKNILLLIALAKSLPVVRWRLFVTLSILGGITGFGYSYFNSSYFESTMILSSEYLNKRIMNDAVEKLNQLAKEKSPKALARELKISDDLGANILKFSAKPFISEADLIEVEVLKEQLKSVQGDQKNAKIIEQVVKRIEIENRHAFEISVRIQRHEDTKAIQNALVEYFRTNQYVSKRIESNKIILKSRKQKLMREAQKLDSLKKVIYANYQTMAEQTRQGSNNVILSDKSVTNPIDVYIQDLLLNDQIENTERKLFLQPDFEVVVGLAEFNEPTSLSKTKIILVSILIGFGLGYLIVGLINFNAYLSTLVK